MGYQLLRDPDFVASLVLSVMIVVAFVYALLKVTEPKYESPEEVIEADGRRYGWTPETETLPSPNTPTTPTTSTEE